VTAGGVSAVGSRRPRSTTWCRWWWVGRPKRPPTSWCLFAVSTTHAGSRSRSRRVVAW